MPVARPDTLPEAQLVVPLEKPSTPEPVQREEAAPKLEERTSNASTPEQALDIGPQLSKEPTEGSAPDNSAPTAGSLAEKLPAIKEEQTSPFSVVV